MHALITQPYLVAAVGAFGVAVLVTILLAHRRLRSASAQENLNLQRIQSFRGDDYRPMERLLAKEDYVFLKRQAGYRAEIGERLRRERREIFRGYLRRLERDFHQLHLFARTLVRDQEQDQPELALALVRSGVAFRWNWSAARTGATKASGS